MDKNFRVNTNDERNIWLSTAVNENLTMASSSSQPQPISSPFHQPENQVNRVNPGSHYYDLETLESSFGGLSFNDSSVGQNGDSIHLPRRTNQVFTGSSSGGAGDDNGYLLPPMGSHHHRELEELQRHNYLNQLRMSYQNDYAHQSYWYNTDGDGNGMLNNGFLNDVPSSSRDRVSDYYTNRFGYEGYNYWRGNEGFDYNQCQASFSAFAKDKEMSERLGMSIFQGTKETVDAIYNGLIGDICELMVDPYGSDVVQLLMRRCSSEQIVQLVDIVTQQMFQFVNICIDSLGTNAIQVLLTCINERAKDQIPRIVDVVRTVALQLSKSNHAIFVILACFRLFPLHCRLLLELIVQNCHQIAIDQHGCCLLQLCFNKDRVPNLEIRQRLIMEAIANALRLCLNCYGNYVVQYIVELNNRYLIDALVRQLIGNYAHLARNKYGSHAVQKLLKLRWIDSRVIVIDLLREIDTLLLDPFGNYVIQTAWFVSKDDVRRMLRYHIERNIPMMRCNKFGNKVLEKLNI
ncbi:pumilio 14 [Arabidopsis thaliana]|uniref:Pumilio homolog 14 n=1 Tax=Arabidopsis thaliana TaxID=3702 RepID=PUM14_ARATH|nr:pumilio 14 [Arabidopsis thaliana]Q4PSD1.1 RecName: Full=Pumilio homolog 14; Short=APUM-14; Short=AtPUM14 [Arabidopsis thaliana]AAY78851.1 pumilio/Puf RNA-binding domain-containing protein [Arabidopsis thaliana]AED94911.1 pumilio 14 [Arabidopsis thaliana]|eukprot:NP_199125.2 pumilio 14 [Arabidopsis thaliana]